MEIVGARKEDACLILREYVGVVEKRSKKNPIMWKADGNENALIFFTWHAWLVAKQM